MDSTAGNAAYAETRIASLKQELEAARAENERIKRDQQAERSLRALLPEDTTVNDDRTELRIEIGHGTIIVEPICSQIGEPMLNFKFERTISQMLV